MKKMILFGAGATAQTLDYHLSRSGYSVEVFTLDHEYIKTRTAFGRPLVPFETLEQHYSPDAYQIMIAVGYSHVNRFRAKRLQQAKNKGYSVFSYIDPSATLWDDAKLGEHCKIGAQSLIQPFAELGENIFIGSNCIIGHHSKIGDHAFLGSGVILGGGVEIGDYAFLGSGAVIRNQARIGKSCVIGAGAVLLDNTPDESVYLAAEAQKMPLSSRELSPG